jgi:hypothetical protein
MNKERPILFNTETVRAILEGRKTQTRRIIKNQLQSDYEIINDKNWYDENTWISRKKTSINPDRYEITSVYKCPYGKVGDILWVRETWARAIGREELTPSEMSTAIEISPERFIVFKASSKEDTHPEHPDWGKKRWNPSIHMPRIASRISLEIINIRVERLNDISEEDAIKEGVKRHLHGYKCYNGINTIHYGVYDACFRKAKDSFESLWVSVYGENSWNWNPWVWVVEFKIILKK